MEQFIEMLKAIGGLGICCFGVFFVLALATISPFILMLCVYPFSAVLGYNNISFILGLLLYCLPTIIYFALIFTNRLPKKYDNEFLLIFFIIWILALPLSFLPINWHI